MRLFMIKNRKILDEFNNCHQSNRYIMTSSFSHITPLLTNFLGYFSTRDRRQQLDLKLLSPRDLADLNLPPVLKGKLMAADDAERIRRSV
jgi:hypothetical protein